MKSSFKFLLSISFMATLILSSCQQSTKKPGVSAEGSITADEVKEKVEEVLFPMPEPMTFFQTLGDIGASYVGDFLNPASNTDNYFTDNSKAAALGVFAADLAYATSYDEKSDINTYSRTLKSLIDDLKLDIDYAYLVKEETQEKMKDRDSLINITTQVFYDTYEFLGKNSDESLSALMANGFYIEALFIATHIMEDTHNNHEMVKLIYEQTAPLNSLIELNSKFEGNEYLKTIQGALLKLKAQYDETDGSLTKEQLNGLTKTIEAIRASLIS